MIRTRIKQNPAEPHERPRPGRASWCGELKLGSLLVPVKAYATVQSASGTQLCQVHAGCGSRVVQPKRCPKHGLLKPDQIGKAFPYSPSQLVELSPTDLQSLTPADKKTIVLEQFFDCESLDLVLLAGRSLQLAPSHAAADPLYAAAVCGLTKTHKWALGHVVLSARRQPVVVRPESHRLILHTLHDPRQLHGLVPLTIGANAAPQKIVKEICAAIKRNTATICWDDLGDDTAQRLAALVNARVNGVKRTNGPAKHKGSRSPRNRQVRKAVRAA